MKNVVSRFVKDESGATAIEYGLLAALIAVVASAGMAIVGTQLDAFFGRIGTFLTGQTVTG
ncbi:MAG: Flp family type IVb pilin [Hyphomicrobiaceae bacterium]